jgi:exosortase/archaeosortase family protein
MKTKKLKKVEKIDFLNIFLRYILALILAFNNLFLFYLIFTPLTISALFLILKMSYPVSISGTSIFLPSVKIELVEACIAGSAYYLLTLLNLATPMKLKKRIILLLYSYTTFFLVNVLRIFILAHIYIKFNSVFDFTHKILWYGLSTIFVVLIWFSAVLIFKIKEIPAYTDIKNLFKLIKKA